MVIGALIIGDEILSGKRQDRHLPHVVETLAARGLSLDYAHYASDDRGRLTAFLRNSFARRDLLLSFGGIGATPDDHTRQAAAAVLLSSVAAGIGAGGIYGLHPVTFLLASGVALVTWVAWAMLAFQIGTRLLPGPETSATLGQLLRTTGFAAAPGLLQVFALLPAMAVPVFSITTGWMFAAMVVGVRHALDYRSTRQALAVCGLAAGLCVSMAVVAGLLFGPVLR